MAKLLNYFKPKLPQLLLGPVFFVLIELFRIFAVTSTGIWEEDVNTWIIHKLAFIALVLPLISLLEGKIRRIVDWSVIALSPALCFFALEYYVHSPQDIPILSIIINLVIFYLLALFLFFMFRRSDVPIILLALVAAIYGFINYFVDVYRGAPILPWDLASIGVASKVAGGYSYPIYPRIGVVFTFIFLLIYLNILCRRKPEFKKLHSWLFCSAASLILLVSSVLFLQTNMAVAWFDLSLNTFEPIVMYRQNGTVVSFLMNLHYVFPEKPLGYSDALLHELDGRYDAGQAARSAQAPDNILVIMNESLSDMSVFSNFPTNQDYLPFYNSLKGTTPSGNLHVSVRGGNTCNTEFEFLTGMSMAFLPSGTIPYQQYIHKELPSLVSNLSALGYETISMHPADATNWNRDLVYDYLGFENTYFYDFFIGGKTYRNFMTDRSMYEKIVEVLDSTQEPTFIFGITMQNHGGYYDSKDLPLDVSVDGLEDNVSLSTYFSLMRESDRALEWLIQELSARDEKTLVLFFGDHQPADEITQPLSETYGTLYDADTPEYQDSLYITPYLFWANYPLNYGDIGDLSINYLSSYLLDIAGLPKSKMDKFLMELHEEYPIVTLHTCLTSDGRRVDLADYSGETHLFEYSSLEYDYLFGGVLDGFWTYK